MSLAGHNVMSDDEFLSRFNPADTWVGSEVANKHEEKKVWTVVDVDGALYALAGYHFVNRTGSYVVTEKPWQTGMETVLLACGCDVDELCQEACPCIPA